MKAFLAIAAFILFSPLTHAAVQFTNTSNNIIGFGTMSDTVLRENQAFSYSGWFYALTDGENNAGLFIRRGGAIFRIAVNQALQFSLAGGTSMLRLAANSSFSLNAWNHLVMTWDGSTTAANVHFYINGTEVSYATTTDAVTPTDNSADTVTIGCNIAFSTAFNGQQSEVAVWSSVLSTADIQALFYGRVHLQPNNIAQSTLVAHWPLDDFADGVTLTGTGTVKDISPNAWHGTATNSPFARAVEQITYP